MKQWLRKIKKNILPKNIKINKQRVKGDAILYIENYIKNVVNKLIRQQGTTDAEELIKSRKNLTFEYESLSENIKGFYTFISEKKRIMAVNEDLEGYEKQFTLYHELGHCVLNHKGEMLLNCPSTKCRKEEYEADLFAAYIFTLHNNITKDNINELLLPTRAKGLINKFLT